MSIYERIEELKGTIDLDMETAAELYNEREAEFVELIGNYVIGAEVECQAYGPGHIISYSGTTLDNLIVEIEFADMNKKFSLPHIITVAKFIKFVDTFEIVGIWNEIFAVHTELTTKFKELDKLAKQIEAEAIKKAKEEKQAEEKFLRTKEKALKDFEARMQAKTPISLADEFYYALGWLAKHAGAVTAALPDYLADSFAKYFGADAPCRIVDSKKKGPAGWTSQWARSFSVSLKKPEVIPAYLTQYLNPKGTAITNTDFVWDLVDNYGFQFGKTQDVEKIRSHVPSQYLSFFEAGIA